MSSFVSPLVKLGRKSRGFRKSVFPGKEARTDSILGALSKSGAEAGKAYRAALRNEGLAATDLALFGLPIGGAVAMSGYDSIDEFFTDDVFEDLLGRQSAASKAQKILSSSAARTEKLKQENLMRLAQRDPQTIQELAAGRFLPRGATVIGGKPDMDAMDRLAQMMVDGEIQQHDPLLEIL